MKKERNYGFNRFDKNKLLFIFSISLFLFFLFLSIGFSAFKSNLTISKISANVRPVTDVRISGLKNFEVKSGALINDSDYNINKIYGTVILPSTDSTVTFEVKVTNLGSTKVGISNILSSNDQITYSISDYSLGEGICEESDCTLGVTKTFYITLKYDDNTTPSNQEQYFELDFSFDTFSSVTYENITCTNCKTEALNNFEFVTTIDINDSELKVSMGDLELIKNNDYTYDSTSKILTINKVTDNIVISKINSIGKLKVGDYIAYNALENGNIVVTTPTGVGTQTDTISTNPTWRVLKINSNGEVVITTEDAVTNTKSKWPFSYYLKGKDAYINGATYLNTVCKEFSNTSYAVYEKGRSINLSDINEINDYTEPSAKTRVYSINSEGYINTYNSANDKTTESDKTMFIFYDGSSWLDLSEVSSKSISISSDNSYEYTLYENTEAQKVLKYKGDTTTTLSYWVADNGVLVANEGYIRYDMKCVSKGKLSQNPLIHSYDGIELDGTYGLRPVVTLKAGLTYTKDSTGVWQISS